MDRALDDEINIAEYFEVVAKRKVLILIFALIVSLAVGWSSLSRKNAYESTVTLLLKSGDNLPKGVSVMAGLMGGGAFRKPALFL
jgi:uncharacterized protein involved in exopolysaccharide biosynthesis